MSAFVKGDPRINRKGRPVNPEKEALRKALINEGLKRGEDFWEKVAKTAFTDRSMMAVVAKKFVPDMSTTEHSGEINVVEMPTVKISGAELEVDIGSEPTAPENTGHTEQTDPVPNADQPV